MTWPIQSCHVEMGQNSHFLEDESHPNLEERCCFPAIRNDASFGYAFSTFVFNCEASSFLWNDIRFRPSLAFCNLNFFTLVGTHCCSGFAKQKKSCGHVSFGLKFRFCPQELLRLRFAAGCCVRLLLLALW